MSSNLYLLFDSAEVLPPLLEGATVPAYSFTSHLTRAAINAPGEPSERMRCMFYAQNYFRIFVADRAIECSRVTAIPPELAAGELR
jgi:hypothetical protein